MDLVTSLFSSLFPKRPMSEIDPLRLNLKNSLLSGRTPRAAFARSCGLSYGTINNFIWGRYSPYRRSVEKIKDEMARRGWLHHEANPEGVVQSVRFEWDGAKRVESSSQDITEGAGQLTDAEKVRVIWSVMDGCHPDDSAQWQRNLQLVGKLFPDLFPLLK